MGKARYIAYDPMHIEFEIFETLEEAKHWLTEGDWTDEGFPDEFVDGDYLIARVTHVSDVKVTDRQENYQCIKGEVRCTRRSCDEVGCDGEEWPYEDHHQWVGEARVRPLKKGE